MNALIGNRIIYIFIFLLETIETLYKMCVFIRLSLFEINLVDIRTQKKQDINKVDFWISLGLGTGSSSIFFFA